MNRWAREPLPGGGLVLAVSGRPGPASLRFETADDGRLLLSQGERPVLLGRSRETTGCCRDLHLHRLTGYRSPLPPLRSSEMRSGVNWAHWYARRLEENDEVPLHDGRWGFSEKAVFQPGIWSEDFVGEWPGGCLELYCGGGWHGVLPLRRLSPPDAPRVKAYRRHAREGTLAPVLLWWVSFLDGWLILDGHDRAVAALAEGGVPVCTQVTRVPDDEHWRSATADVTQAYERHMEGLASCPEGPETERRRVTVEQGYGDTLASLPYEGAVTRSWPLPGGAAAWDGIADRVRFRVPE
ncbi:MULTISPECIES: hypothetical protein [Streptomyces]|uniref:hypothetical protein n=1 Tax=Streptomyces TaxID=1883 RepID=UPI003711028D